MQCKVFQHSTRSQPPFAGWSASVGFDMVWWKEQKNESNGGCQFHPNLSDNKRLIRSAISIPSPSEIRCWRGRTPVKETLSLLDQDMNSSIMTIIGKVFDIKITCGRDGWLIITVWYWCVCLFVSSSPRVNWFGLFHVYSACFDVQRNPIPFEKWDPGVEYMKWNSNRVRS